MLYCNDTYQNPAKECPMSLSCLWRLSPLAAALLICSEAHALELPSQIITGNPLGSAQLA
jgi:iron complex outermembrane receptor protein